MNAAQIHLALNHVPLILSVTGGLILLFGMIRKNESIKTLSLYLLVAAAIVAIPVFLSGEGTEELVEKLPGVSETNIEEHEEMAKTSMVIIIITGIVALAGLFLKRIASVARLVLIATLVLSFVSFAAMAQTAHLGGLVRHSELQNGAVANGSSENEKATGDSTVQKEKESNDDDDDD
jgi:uncharacterized membrane protein